MPIASAALSALPPMMQTGAGAIQTLIGGIRAHKTQKALENLKTPFYAPNKAIGDYYSESLNRYNVNPYSSALYRTAENNANRSTATGLGYLQGGRNAISGVSRLSAIQNDTMMKAAMMAENQRNQRFGQLGGATQMKSADDLRAFQQNKIAPYEKKYNLLALKASGANKMLDAGLQNLFSGGAGASQIGSDYALNQNSGYGSGATRGAIGTGNGRLPYGFTP